MGLSCFLFCSVATAGNVQDEGPAQAPELLVGEISIQSSDIFSAEELERANPVLGFMQSGMNKVHISTRENVLRREILFQTGEPLDPELLSETERNLRTLGFLTNVAVVATDTTVDGRVNIAVRTWETWTLRANVSFARASNGDQRWSSSLSEKNFFGLGTTLGGGIGADENNSYWNLWYRHRRMFGSPFWLGMDYSNLEKGHAKKIFLSRPFFAQADPWSFTLEVWDNLLEVRHYLSHGGVSGVDDTASTNLHAILPNHEKGFEGRFLVRAKGKDEGRIWRLGGGLRIVDTTFETDEGGHVLSDGRTVNLDYLLQQNEPLDLVQGLTVYPFLWMETIGRQWTKESFVMQYGTVEDIPLGLSASFKGGLRGKKVGSTTGSDLQFYTEFAVSRWKRLLGGLALLTGGGRLATGEGNNQSHRVSLLGGWIGKNGSLNAPWISRVFIEAGHGRNLIGSQVFVLGLDRGLRSLDFDGMAGNRLLRWNFEQGKATTWEPLNLFRLGGAVFYSGGLAQFDDEDRGLGDARHEVGLGIRMGPTRSANSQLGRLDVSWALDGSTGAVFTATTRGTF